MAKPPMRQAFHSFHCESKIWLLPAGKPPNRLPPAAPSNTWFSVAWSKSRSTGTYTDDIPASMKGNSYHFYIKIYGGQYLNAQMQMTLVKSYNSSNP